jgi:hypothetical protein
MVVVAASITPMKLMHKADHAVNPAHSFSLMFDNSRFTAPIKET